MSEPAMSARDFIGWAASAVLWGLVATHVVAPIATAVARGGQP